MKGSEDRYLHDRVKRHLLSLIGASPSGAKLPSRTRLAKDLSVARTTIERAVSELIGEGYLRAVDGSGTYVTSTRPARRRAAEGAAMNWGLVIPDIVGDTFPQILRGLEDYAHKVNCHLIVCNSDNDYTKQYAYLLRLRDSGIAGLAIVPPLSTSLDLEGYRLLARERIPFVFCVRGVEGVAAPRVVSNNFYGSCLATRHLVSLGYRRIAFLSGPVYATVEQRLHGYLSVLAESSIPVDPALIVHQSIPGHADPGHTSEEGRRIGYEGTGRLLESPRFDAIFCFNDYIAYGAYLRLVESGIRVPDDTALIGYDDSPICGSIPVALTTVRYPKYETGWAAGEMLWRMVSASTPIGDELVIINPELCVRESCGQHRTTPRP
jgi:DNA-binding LacI/PurR family transcriptional regulator